MNHFIDHYQNNIIFNELPNILELKKLIFC